MRTRILTILNEQVASPNEIAQMLDERLPNVSYHVRALHDLGTIELVRTAQRRGAIEHYYRALMRPFFSDRDWKRIPRAGRQAISDAALKIIFEDVGASLQAGTFENRADRHLSHNDVVLDTEPRMALEMGQPFSAFFASSLIPARSMPSRPSTTALRADETTFSPASLRSPVTVDVTRIRRAVPPCLPIVLASTIA